MSETMVSGLWWIHLAATFYMTGLIWFVQRVHYPLMNRVESRNYRDFQEQHMRRTAGVVGPLMLLEACTAAVLLYARPEGVSFGVALLNFILLLAIWISTAALQVPAHQKLSKDFDAQAHERLVRTNWIRTALWSGRALLLLVVTIIAMGGGENVSY